MVNSSEILAEQAQALYGRLPKPVNFTTLINEQIAPELIGAIRLIASGEKKQSQKTILDDFKQWEEEIIAIQH